MPYVTVVQPDHVHQITWEDVLYDRVPFYHNRINTTNNTRTFKVERFYTIRQHLRMVNIDQLILLLETFNATHDDLFKAKREDLYHTFYLPKKKGGYRRIDAPLPPLMEALRELKQIFEYNFNALHHTAAFAYAKKRSTITAMRRHQQNQSRWFLKTDFSNFFGSTTEDFTWRMISQIFPFSEVIRSQRGADALHKALNLCFYNGSLPQGTPISPTLTNLVMIPIDHRLYNELRQKHFVYTRYADDIQISHRENFDYNLICEKIDSVLHEFDAPFRIKPSKTRYGSSAGQNWNLGVMLNKDNKLTVGWKAKQYLKSACHNYIRDKKNGERWDPHEVCVLSGKIAYYKMVEPDYVEGFLSWFNHKNNCNLIRMLRDELK